QMTIGMGIAFGALSLRVAALARGDAARVHYVLDDFRWAFIAAGVLALLTLPGYAGLAADAGDRLRANVARG
ncbi:MFS transporter, partial [Paraburkholderia sp. SIMBA_050]